MSMKMKPQYLRWMLAGIGLWSATALQASQAFAVGDPLTPQQMARFSKAVPLRVGDTVLREIGSQSLVTMSLGGAASSGPVSQVVNEQGRVGESRNEIVISQVPVAELQQRLQPVIQNAVSVQYDVPRAITRLRFNSLPTAVRAHDSVLRLWPQARVVLPVRYGP